MTSLQWASLVVICAIGLDTRCPSEVIEDAAARGCYRARARSESQASDAPPAMDPVEWCWRSLGRDCSRGDWDCLRTARKTCITEVARHRRLGSRYCPPPGASGVAMERLSEAESAEMRVEPAREASKSQ